MGILMMMVEGGVTSQVALAGKPFCFTNQKEFYMEHYTRTVHIYFAIFTLLNCVTLFYIVLHGTPYSESNSTLLLLHCVTFKTKHLTLLYTVLHCVMTLCYIVYILLRFVTLFYTVLHCI